MKKPTNKKEPVISITATLSETRLLKKLIEKLACTNRKSIAQAADVQEGWRAFKSSSIEAFVSGNIHLVCQADLVNKPFVKGFVFTCIDSAGGDYDLVWGSSLS